MLPLFEYRHQPVRAHSLPTWDEKQLLPEDETVARAFRTLDTSQQHTWKSAAGRLQSCCKCKGHSGKIKCSVMRAALKLAKSLRVSGAVKLATTSQYAVMTPTETQPSSDTQPTMYESPQDCEVELEA